MSVTPSGTGTDVAAYDDSDIGLEDVGAGDVVLPRLSIDHPEAQFRNNLTKEEFSETDAVILGLVKQRIMWDSDVDEGDKPQCKSPDFIHGFPQTSDDVPKDKRFPWDESNFNKDDFEPDPEHNDLITLPCSSCAFSQWGKDKTPPRCAEQHTYPLIYNSTPDAEPEESVWIPALLSVQKTGIKPSKQYISVFAQSKTAMFTVITHISLQAMKKGSVKYSIPVFKKGDQTDRSEWGGYADQYRGIREYIRSAPRNEGDFTEDGGGSTFDGDTNVNKGPETPKADIKAEVVPEKVPTPAVAATAAKPEPTPAPASAPASSDEDDEELPF